MTGSRCRTCSLAIRGAAARRRCRECLTAPPGAPGRPRPQLARGASSFPSCAATACRGRSSTSGCEVGGRSIPGRLPLARRAQIVELDGFAGPRDALRFPRRPGARPPPPRRRLRRHPDHLVPARRRTRGDRQVRLCGALLPTHLTGVRRWLVSEGSAIQAVRDNVRAMATRATTDYFNPRPRPCGRTTPGRPRRPPSARASRPCATRWGFSLRDLAERSGVSAPMLSQVERGETSPTLAVAEKIAAGLELTLSQLLRLDEGAARRRQPRRRAPPLRARRPPLRGADAAAAGPARRRLPAHAGSRAPRPAAATTRRCTSRAAARPPSSSTGTLALVVDGARHELARAATASPSTPTCRTTSRTKARSRPGSSP